MTAQFMDMVRYQDEDWSLAGVNGAPLFDPAAHGLSVYAGSSACWRGFVCGYAIRDGAFFLDDLQVSIHMPAPELFGRSVQPRDRVGFNACYMSLQHSMSFTGGLLLARGFVRELYVHMGFHPAWKYERVLEAEVEEGVVLRVTDCSKAMVAIREKLAGTDRPGPGSSQADISEWIDRAFSRKY